MVHGMKETQVNERQETKERIGRFKETTESKSHDQEQEGKNR